MTSRPAKVSQTTVGLGYVDDCLILALNYITSYSYSSGTATPNHTIGLTLSLRTLGMGTVNQAVGKAGRADRVPSSPASAVVGAGALARRASAPRRK